MAKKTKMSVRRSLKQKNSFFPHLTTHHDRGRGDEGIKNRKLGPLKNMLVFLLIVAFTTGVYFLQAQTQLFRTSMFKPEPEAAPFDGTTLPLRQLPDYTKLTREERRQDKSTIASNLFAALPLYDITRLGKPWEGLGSSAEDNATKQAKMTYTIVYTGDYSMDYQEGKGGHPGVDIICPPNSEVYAIANGVVVKAQNASASGNYVVIKHKNVPSLEDPNKLVTYYSSYLHLNSFNVAVYDVVKKGQLIGLSGSTGNSTAPHLHFQVDNDDAPWHPYWPTPFTAEAAVAMSVHPMKWIYKYQNYQSGLVANNNNVVADTPVAGANDAAGFSVTTSGSLEVGQKGSVNIKVLDKSGNVIKTPTFANPVSLIASSGNLLADSLSAANFVNGEANVEFTPTSEGDVQLTAKSGTASGIGVIKVTATVIANGNNSAGDSIFPDVPTTNANYQAIKFLKENNIISGYSDGTFQPDRTVSRAELLKIILLGTGKNVDASKKADFPDVPESAWYTSYVAEAKDQGVVGGYSDGTFQPDKVVNKTEALKIILETMKVNFTEPTADPYPDAPASQWYAKYVQYSKDHSLIDVSGNFNPTEGMTRAMVAEVMYRLMK